TSGREVFGSLRPDRRSALEILANSPDSLGGSVETRSTVVPERHFQSGRQFVGVVEGRYSSGLGHWRGTRTPAARRAHAGRLARRGLSPGWKIGRLCLKIGRRGNLERS